MKKKIRYIINPISGTQRKQGIARLAEERTDKDILYFTAGGYSACGSPAYKYKDHYFSRWL